MTAVKKFADKLTSVLLSLLISGMCLNILPTADANSAEQRDFNKMANEVCILVNEARAEAGLEPLYMVPYLCDAANVRARECITLLSHTRPGGENFNTVIDGGLVPFSRAGENIAAGSDNVEDAFEQWRNSESHWNAILNPKYTHIGIGICYEPNSEFEWYWTQLFVAVDQPLDNQYIPEYTSVPNDSLSEYAGDLNADGVINSFDLVIIEKYLMGAFTLDSYQLQCADIYQDGIVDENDVRVLTEYILGKITEFPVEPTP